MIKKLLLIFFALAALTVFGIHVFSQKAPELLRDAIESALNKKVLIKNIEYHFPRVFELDGFSVQETDAPFKGEGEFHVDHVSLEISPISFSRKELVINRIEVENADIVIRKMDGKLYHAFSDVMEVRQNKSAAPSGNKSFVAKALPDQIPLKIHSFVLKGSHFKFIDYDAAEQGFVVVFDKINSKIKNINIPADNQKTFYQIDAEMIQGREIRRAPVQVSGWTGFDSWDTDATFSIKGVYLPFFEPYYGQVTGAKIEDGYSDVRAGLKILDKQLDLNLGFELSGLLFDSYEMDNQLFGLKADEILSFLKDSSGRLKFQIVVKWNLSDRSVRLKDVFRRSIERSLRETVLGNVGNILANTLQKIGDSGVSSGKGGLDDKIKKIKDFFKY